MSELRYEIVTIMSTHQIWGEEPSRSYCVDIDHPLINCWICCSIPRREFRASETAARLFLERVEAEAACIVIVFPAMIFPDALFVTPLFEASTSQDPPKTPYTVEPITAEGLMSPTAFSGRVWLARIGVLTPVKFRPALETVTVEPSCDPVSLL